MTYEEPSIQEAVTEFTRWARHPQSYQQWFVSACPAENMRKLVIFYRPRWIGDAELELQAHSTFMTFPVIMKPVEETKLPVVTEAMEPRTAHDLKCPGCGYPCVKCHGKKS